MNFLCISLFFCPFVFVVFFIKIRHKHFLKHDYAKINYFQPLKVKILIFMWINWKNTICIGFVHKITFWSNFWVDKTFSKGRGFKTVCPGATNLVSKDARHLKEKSHEMSRREHLALRNNLAKGRGGGHSGPPSRVRVNFAKTFDEVPHLSYYVR